MPIAVTDTALRPLLPVRARRAALAEAGVRVRIWDLPTRVFHWSLAASLVGLTVTGYAGGAWMTWHARIGSLLLALLLFRIAWGFIGGHWSRFVNFVPTPRGLQRYLRGQGTPQQEAGHSPLGALSILAMLAVLLGQAVTGLLGDDGGGYTGPLNELVSSAAGLAATALHKQVGQWLLFALVLLHLLAILFYRIVRRRKLVRAMLDGDKLLPQRLRASRDDTRSRLVALGVLCGCIGLVGFLTGF